MHAGKVMIVEDEALTGILYKKSLTKKGFNIIGPFSTGEDAISEALKEEPFVILMDIHLAGGIDGIEAGKRITDKIKTNIIFLTAYSEDKYANEVRKIKAAAYFEKPIDLNKLADLIKSLK